MIKLNLATKTKEQELIKSYLEQNASELLANKINNGVRITKDNTTIISKKDLDGFMTYANTEARKLAENGASYAMVEDKTVFGWAIHYFGEDSIEGKLYNLDGSEYKPLPKEKVTKQTSTTKKKNQPQMTLFDIGLEDNNNSISNNDLHSTHIEDKKTLEDLAMEYMEQSDERLEEEYNKMTELENAIDGKVEIDGELIDFKEFDGDIEDITTEENTKVSPLYQKYMSIQNDYPNSVIAYRLGDFYEIFGEYAVRISNMLDLTLTGRDCGLKERVPMIGFPYHVSDIYFKKINSEYNLIVVEPERENDIKFYAKYELLEKPKEEDNKSKDNELVQKIIDILGDIVEVRL